MADQYNDREIIDSFYLQGGCPNNTDGMCKDLLCQSGRCICPDQEQMILLLAQWVKKLDGKMTFSVKPFWKHEGGEGCRDVNLKGQIGASVLVKTGIQDVRLMSCLKYVSEHEIHRGEKLMQAVPFILGINSRYEIRDRESTVRFCLEPCIGGGVFQGVLQMVLEETLNCLIDNKDTHQIRFFLKDFFEKLKEECYEDGELNACIRESYDVIAKSLQSRELILLNNKYKALRTKWVNRDLKCQGDVMSCLKERCDGWRNILLLVYILQIVYSEIGSPLILPEIFGKKNLSVVLGGIPNIIKMFVQIIRGIMRIRDCQEKEAIGKCLIKMVRRSDLNWDEELLTELHGRVERATRKNI